MAEILPFRALRYNPDRVGELARVVTQPYDKITPEMQARYYDRSPYNLARIIRGRVNPDDTPENSVYTRAAAHFAEWREKGVLAGEREPALYPYSQEYAVPGRKGERRERRGFIALLKLEDYSAGVVHRHEETLSGPKADRLELLKATRAHFGQIFLLYSDPAGEIESALAAGASKKPWECVTDEYATRHSVWRVAEAGTIARVVEAMRAKKLVIADGHHRYETALAYRHLRRAEGAEDARAEYVMATFVRKETEGLTILPTHRVVRGLEEFEWPRFLEAARGYFEVESVSVTGKVERWARRGAEGLASAGRKRPTLAAYAGAGRLALFGLRDGLDLVHEMPDVAPGLRRLDVIVLHRLLLERALGITAEAVREEKNLSYVREFEEAVARVESGAAQLAFLMNPTPIEAVWENALAGRPLPQKSTDFYPKLLSGLTIYWLDNPAGL
jgi:uncharacterized protein (DUF1015 family)